MGLILDSNSETSDPVLLKVCKESVFRIKSGHNLSYNNWVAIKSSFVVVPCFCRLSIGLVSFW